MNAPLSLSVHARAGTARDVVGAAVARRSSDAGPAGSEPGDGTGAARAGIPVLLIHGFTSDADTDWAGWAEALAAAGRPSYAVDLPAHGSSPAPASAEEATTARITEALAAVIAAVGAEEIDVIGYSLGARLAWELPGRSPVPVRRLVLGGISPAEPFALIDFGQLRAFAADGTAPADPFTGMIAGMISRPGLDTPGLARCAEGLAREPFDPDAHTAPRVPTLFAAGTDDPMSAGIGTLTALVPGARLVSLPGDHLAALASAEFRDAALEFLAE